MNATPKQDTTTYPPMDVKESTTSATLPSDSPPADHDVFYNFPTEDTDPHKQEYAEQRAKEQAATNLFLHGLRRAVQKYISNQPAPTPPLPHYAYNNTTRELARLHGYPHYHQTQPNSKLDTSLNHLDDHLEYHVCLYEHQIIREEKQKLAAIKQKLETTDSPFLSCWWFTMIRIVPTKEFLDQHAYP